MNKFRKILDLSFYGVLAFTFLVNVTFSSEITYDTDSFQSGQTLTHTDLNNKFNEIKSAVNDNNQTKSGLEWVEISQVGVDIRTTAINVGEVVVSAPSAGYVIVRFDGQACPSTGDRITLAASDTSATWSTNDGNVGVYGDGTTGCKPFSHTRVYTVSSSGDYSYYAVAHNWVDKAGDGLASVYATLTAQYFPVRY